MRAIMFLLFIVPLLSSAVSAEPTDIHVDVPGNSKNLEVNVVEQDLGPGQTTGWQIHHGYEIAYVLSGSVDLQMGGSPIRHLAIGQTFEIERDVAHKVANDGPQPAALLITYLRDKTGPASIPVPPPAVH